VLQGGEHLVGAIAVDAEIVGAVALRRLLMDLKRQGVLIREALTERERVTEEEDAFGRALSAIRR
jgi:hypothetical protein